MVKATLFLRGHGYGARRDREPIPYCHQHTIPNKLLNRPFLGGWPTSEVKEAIRLAPVLR